MKISRRINMKALLSFLKKGRKKQKIRQHMTLYEYIKRCL